MLAGLIAILTFSVIPDAIDAKLYQKYNKVYINEQEYEANVIKCSENQFLGYIDKSINCLDWVLTKEGETGLEESKDKIGDDIIKGMELAN